jgi:hypothetical protein
MPVLTTEQYNIFKTLIDETLGDFLLTYQKKLKEFVSGYVSKFPAHVRASAKQNGFYLFVAMFPHIALIWQQQGRLHIPNGTVCDVLIGHE